MKLLFAFFLFTIILSAQDYLPDTLVYNPDKLVTADELFSALQVALEYIEEPATTTLIYKDEKQLLRERIDYIERKEHNLNYIKQIILRYEKHNKK